MTDDRPKATDEVLRRPRLAVMGEFSAGKSTLTNLLLGARALPEKVTATQLPPVWITEGEGEPVRIDLDGGEEAIGLAEIGEVNVADTWAIRMQRQAKLLSHCDLIDFPGISDPNMDSEVWERLLPEVNGVIWCTHATQAWRRSEAAAWRMVPDAVRARSALLVTRFDKILSERDRARVLKRVEVEAGPQFNSVFPVSLIQAFDEGTLGESGFEPVRHWIDAEFGDGPSRPTTARKAPTVAPKAAPVAANASTDGDAPSSPQILPRRVRPRRAREVAPQTSAI